MDSVKSIAMLRLISQPPKTYSRKFTDFWSLKLTTFSVYDLALRVFVPFLRSDRVVYAVPRFL